MILYEPRERIRNQDTMQALKDLGTIKPQSPADRIDRACSTIVDALIEIHGREISEKCLVQVDHQAGFLMIAWH